MGLYLGSNKQKINVNDAKYCLKLPLVNQPVIHGIKLLSKEGYILKDLNGLYLLVKEDK